MNTRTRAAVIATAYLVLAGGVQAQGFNVSQVAHLSLGQSGDIAANGDIVFVPQWFDGVAIIDVSTPATPNLLTTWDHPTDEFRCLDARPLGNHVYLSAEFGSTFGLISLDVTNPSVPTVEVEFDQSTYPEFVHNLTIANDMLFLSGYGSNGGNVIVDVTSPTSPNILATIDTDIHDNTVVGNKLYISGGFEATYIYDITTPTAPVQEAVFSPNSPDSVFYQHNAYPIPGTSYLVSTEELEVATGGGSFQQGSVRVIDFTVLAAPVEVWRWRSDGAKADPLITPHNAYVVGDFMYLSHYQDGLKVFDLDDPSNPVEVGFFDTHPATPTSFFIGCFGVDPFQGPDRIFASDEVFGFFHLSFNEARRTTIQGTVRDANTNAPIPGATVHSVTALRTVTADGSGDYRLDTGSGSHDFEVSAPDYVTLDETIALSDFGSLSHDFFLTPLAVDVPQPVVNVGVRLSPASPNPFNPTTSLRYDIDAGSAGKPLSIAVFDARGNRVRTLATGRAASGSWSVVWDGRDDTGTDVASGVYHARLRAGGQTSSQKLVLMK